MKRTFNLWDKETKTSVSVEATKSGREWKALCPKHADKNPSLSINPDEKIFKCFGCDFSGSLYNRLKDPANSKLQPQKQIAAVYDYRDETGNLIFQTVRYSPKDFRQRRPDGNGDWIWNMEGVKTVLYNLPNVLKADEIIIAEGEKDADNLVAIGFTATTCPMGARKWRTHYNEVLKGKDIILCPDNDEKGREHMMLVASSLYGLVRSLKWLDLPGLPYKGDISDWINGIGDKEDPGERLSIMIEGADPYTPSKAVTDERKNEDLSYSVLNLPSSLQVSRLEIEVKWTIKNLIPEQGITLLHSIGGVGKTYLTQKMGRDVAEGEVFFGLDVQKTPVYLIDFENPLPEISERMKKIGGSDNLKIWHLGHDPAPVRFDLDEWYVYKTFPPGLFIIDSLRSSHLLEENSSKDAAFIMARHKELRALGNTVILIHHESKSGGYRGSTAWFDLADHILKFGRVKQIGSDEDAQDDDLNLPIRLGLGGKSRFSSAMELKPMYFKFQDHQLCLADDPDSDILNKMAGLLKRSAPPNQSEFQQLVKENLGIGQKDFRKLLKKGENRNIWFSKPSGSRNKLEYFGIVK